MMAAFASSSLPQPSVTRDVHNSERVVFPSAARASPRSRPIVSVRPALRGGRQSLFLPPPVACRCQRPTRCL